MPENKMPPQLDKLSREQVHQFYKIVKEELEKYNLYWEHLQSASRMRVVTEARWSIIHRLKTEMERNPSQISNMLGLDRTTVKNALRKMDDRGVAYFESKPVCHYTEIRTKRKLKKWAAITC